MTMDEKEITALAREYAEEIYPHEEGEDLGQMSFLRNNATKHISSTLKMLLRRYCLVEKSKVRKQLESAQRLIEARDYNKQCIGVGCRGVIERLFPAIGKEVEE